MEKELAIRRHQIAIVAASVLLIANIAWLGPKAWQNTMYERMWVFTTLDGHCCLGFFTAKRWSRASNPVDRAASGEAMLWYAETGTLAAEGVNGIFMVTTWDFGGEIHRQTTRDGQVRVNPPWLWEVPEQTNPSAPWIASGLTAEEWWDTLPRELRVDRR